MFNHLTKKILLEIEGSVPGEHGDEAHLSCMPYQ
jgi:hypothetical protein